MGRKDTVRLVDDGIGGFLAFARAAFALAGVEVGEDDLALVAMIHAGFAPRVAALLAADVSTLPFAPIDPRRAPDRS
jgi:hypothetical protein